MKRSNSNQTSLRLSGQLATLEPYGPYLSRLYILHIDISRGVLCILSLQLGRQNIFLDSAVFTLSRRTLIFRDIT